MGLGVSFKLTCNYKAQGSLHSEATLPQPPRVLGANTSTLPKGSQKTPGQPFWATVVTGAWPVCACWKVRLLHSIACAQGHPGHWCFLPEKDSGQHQVHANPRNSLELREAAWALLVCLKVSSGSPG